MPAILGRRDDCSIDPYRAIACAVLDQAVEDLKHYRKDPVKALDASLFLVTEGAEFCTVAGFKVTEEHWEDILVRIF